MAAAAIGAALGGSTLSGAFGLGQQALSNKGALDVQNSQNDFNRWNVQNREKAFTEQGLPRFAAYGNQPNLPNTFTHMGGNNFARTGINGQSFNVSNGLMPQLFNMYNSNVNSYRSRGTNTFSQGSQTHPYINTANGVAQTNPTTSPSMMGNSMGTQTQVQDIPPSPQEQALRILQDFKAGTNYFR